MSSKAADRNLLVGILGLQLGLISESQLIEAMQKWMFRKSDSIELILEECGAINSRSRESLSEIARQHLKVHNNDPIESISALGALTKICTPLLALDDVDLDATISVVLQDSLGTPGLIEPEATFMPVRMSSDNDRFQILRPHAHGGLGVVSIAEDSQLHREVALKEIKAELVNDPGSRSRFMVEAEVTGRLEHPGIVPVYSLGTASNGTPFYAMRLIRGQSMKSMIAELHKSRPMFDTLADGRELRKLIRRLIDVCNAIEYAHSRGVLHRDIKPANIMLGRYGETLVVDWGLARAGTRNESHASSDETTVVPQSGDSSSETKMGSVVGTIAYMSPEQAEGRLDLISTQSDVYSLGATLYCILTGQSPVASAKQEDMLQRVRLGKIDSPLTLNETIPRPLEAVCLKALALDQNRRYQKASSLAEELERWLGDEPVVAYPEPVAKRISRWVKKHRMFVTTAAGVLVTATIALAAVAVMVRGQNVVLKDAYNQVAVAEKQATQERDAAIEQRDLTLRNLDIARTLAMAMLDRAESRLSKGDASPRTLIEVRSDLTELAFDNFRKLHESNPGDREFSWQYAKVARVSGNLKRNVRQLETANERIQLSLQLQNQIAADQRTPAESDYLAETYRELATNLMTAGKIREAEVSLVRSAEICEGLQKSHPENLNYIRTTALAQIELVAIETQQHHFEKAGELAEKVVAAFTKLAATEEPHAVDAAFAMFGRCHQVEILLRSKKFPEASAAAKETLALVRDKRLALPNDQFLPQALISILMTSAEIELATNGDPSTAVAWLDEAFQTVAALKTTMRSAALVQNEATILCFRAEALRKQSKLSDSASAIQAARNLAENLLKNVDIPLHNFLMFRIQMEESHLLQAEAKMLDATQRLNEAIDSLKKASEQSMENVEYQQQLSRLKAEHPSAEKK